MEVEQENHHACKDNFSHSEIVALIRAYECRKCVLQSMFKSSVTIIDKMCPTIMLKSSVISKDKMHPIIKFLKFSNQQNYKERGLKS